MAFYMAFPRPIKCLYAKWLRYVKGDETLAGVSEKWHLKSSQEQWDLVAGREAHKAEWHT